MSFLIQIATFLVDPKDPEFVVSIVGIFVATITLFLAVYFAQMEALLGTGCIIVGCCRHCLSLS